MSVLIAFYSRAGENYFEGAYRRVHVGNTKKAAKLLNALTGAVVKKGLAIRGSTVAGAKAALEAWVREN